MKACGFRRPTKDETRVICLNTKQIEHTGTVSTEICKTCRYARQLTFFDMTMLLAKRQQQFRRQPVASGCCTKTIRHLTYHIWPTRHSNSWKWNLKLLASFAEWFNGERIFGIVIDEHTVAADDVLAELKILGITPTRVIVKRNNSKLREVHTWYEMMKALPVSESDDNHFVFSAHAKGVRHEGNNAHIYWWAACMYLSCIPAISQITQSDTVDTIGPFRRLGWFWDTSQQCNWHYSGTFFWWRLNAVTKIRKWKNADRVFYGTETWIGKLLSVDRSLCCFLDRCGDLYDRHYWDTIVIPAWESQFGPNSFAEVRAACPA
jgi:hypothetical protein